MLAEITADELSLALDRSVAGILRSAKIVRPPVDAHAIARSLGIAVARDDRQRGRARIVRLSATYAGPTSILLRSDPRPERHHWAIAHEIGEAHAHYVFARLGIDPREAADDARERVANLLASRLLLPTRWVARAAERHGWDLQSLKRRFATASHELIARRMLDFAPPVIVTIFDEGRITFRRSNVLGQLPPLSALEQRCQFRAHRTGKPTHDEEGALVASAWAIHEPTWRREIVRVELGEGDTW